jgi:hypothetical protein
MRRCLGGNGQDTTAAVLAYLAANKTLHIKHLILIGDADNPQSIWVTDHEAPLVWSPWGTFLPAVVARGSITTKIGLDVGNTTVTWSPGNSGFTVNSATSSPYALAQLGFYDNWPVRIWRCYMPTPGDANTLGASELFGGRVDSTTIGRGQIQFKVNSFLAVVTQKLPANVIEVTNTTASYATATPPAGDSHIPVFATFTGSTKNAVLGDCLSPTAGHVYGNGTFTAGYLVFLAGPGATLAGFWSAVGYSLAYTDGDSNKHNQFNLYSPLPWPPTPGADTFYVSSTAPINQADGDYFGFPWVPSPQTAV